jgi:hypothetical protein
MLSLFELAAQTVRLRLIPAALIWRMGAEAELAGGHGCLGRQLQADVMAAGGYFTPKP